MIADAERRLRQGQSSPLDVPQGGSVGSPTGMSDNGKVWGENFLYCVKPDLSVKTTIMSVDLL